MTIGLTFTLVLAGLITWMLVVLSLVR